MRILKISHLQLHKAQFIPQLFEFKRTINQQFYPGIYMELNSYGILCKYKSVTFIIPTVCAECIVLEDSKDVEELTQQD